jgi:hypothetical protein
MDFKNDIKLRTAKNEQLKDELSLLRKHKIDLMVKTKKLKYERNLILTQLMAKNV